MYSMTYWYDSAGKRKRKHNKASSDFFSASIINTFRFDLSVSLEQFIILSKNIQESEILSHIIFKRMKSFHPHCFRTEISKGKTLQKLEFPKRGVFNFLIPWEGNPMNVAYLYFWSAKNCIKCAWIPIFAHQTDAHSWSEAKNHCDTQFSLEKNTEWSSVFFSEISSAYFISFNASHNESSRNIFQYEWCTNMQLCTDDLAQLFLLLWRSVKFYTTRTCVVLKFHPLESSRDWRALALSFCVQIIHDYYTDFVVKIYCGCASDESSFPAASIESMARANE